MEFLKISDAKRIAMEKANLNGHEMRPWRRYNGAPYRIRSSCKLCGCELLVLSSGDIDTDTAIRMKELGIVIGHSEVLGTNFTYIEGPALSRCRRAYLAK